MVSKTASPSAPRPSLPAITSQVASSRVARRSRTRAPIIPQVSQIETLIDFHIEDFVQPEMAPTHAVQEIALAGAQFLRLSFKEEIEHRPAFAKVEIESKPTVVGEICLF